jgi:hypothetical protein
MAVHSAQWSPSEVDCQITLDCMQHATCTRHTTYDLLLLGAGVATIESVVHWQKLGRPAKPRMRFRAKSSG